MPYPRIIVRSRFCDHCGLPYEATHRTQRFCTLACGYAHATKPRPNVECPICGKPFEIPVHDVGKVKYCSYACNNKSRTVRVENVCRRCGVTFLTSRGRVRKYCTDECARNDRSANAKEKAEIVCKVCGKTRHGFPSEAKRQYCSIACMAVAAQRQSEFTCLHCGRCVTALPNRARDARFCSRRCYQKYRGETGPERLTREALTALGVAFEPQHAISRYSLDFYLPAHSVDLEVDGEYWHQTAKQQDVDTRRDAFLSKHGIRTIRLTDTEIKKSGCVPSLIASRLGIKWQGQMALQF